jgi:catechol-2,3-dioxygenase
MHIQELRLAAHDLPALQQFYGAILGLPTQLHANDTLTITIGRSRLVFTHTPVLPSPIYHFAINIPPHQFDAAASWIRQHTQLIADSNGRDLFYSEDWDAHNLYFYDPAGNIAELIARQTLPHPSETPFGAASLLNISEIGLATDDLPRLVDRLRADVQLLPYRGRSEIFTAVGDEHGLLIIVARGRIWFPETGKPALNVPISVDLVLHDRTITLVGPPYHW